jgi:uncharacterized RDD family membrane protein YckC
MAKLILNPTSSTRREVNLTRNLLSIGRDPSNDLVLPDAMVSRRHAVIEHRGSQYYLRDCNSSNGSVVNGDRVSERSLRDGDLVAIGTARMLFRDDIRDSGAKVVQHPSSPRLECAACQTEYRKGDQFCRECGAALAQSGPPRVVCSSCGSAVLLPARFCNACGTALTADRARIEPSPAEILASAASAPPAAEPPSAEPPPKAPLELDDESDEPATRPSGSAPEIESPPSSDPARPVEPPPPSDPPRGGGFEASVPQAPRGSRAVAVAPVLSPAVWPMARPLGRSWREEVPRLQRSVAPESRPRAAALGIRLVAGFLDLVVVAAGASLLLGPLAYYWWVRDLAEVTFLPVLASVTLSVLTLFLAAAYFIVFWGMKGATPGKDLLDLRVTRDDGQSPIGLGRAALRLLGYLLSAASLGIGFLMIAVAEDGLHDRVAGTRVVRGGPRKA